MLSKSLRIANPRCQSGSICIFRCLYDSDDFKFFALIHEFLHIFLIIGFILPDLVLAVIFVAVRHINQFKSFSNNILIGICSDICRSVHIFFIDKFLDHFVQFHLIPQSQSIKEKITHASVRSQHQYTFIIILRPASRLHIILVLIKPLRLRHFIKNIGTHHC